MRVRHLQQTRASSKIHAESNATQGNAIGWASAVFRGSDTAPVQACRPGSFGSESTASRRETVVRRGSKYCLVPYLDKYPTSDLKRRLFLAVALMGLNHFWHSFKM
ncbi:uncharacterized protein PpBr36_09521 [Pyricularia pennisetigena]|uniref:uncharacterized protein n=1 Tax=Pyricularia pennisetigena TaxID=1578925 RepID=UPI001153C9F6|nr:uncharacterized protein PpBr36_09521 [Pyricularia pennisetigena]TLS21828.1 hypothetical protein PpBr36_09521 [Pyricularia pennisetigena]